MKLTVGKNGAELTLLNNYVHLLVAAKLCKHLVKVHKFCVLVYKIKFIVAMGHP